MAVLKFYSNHPELGFLSNFYPCILSDPPYVFGSVEAFFQAGKYMNRGDGEATRIVTEKFSGLHVTAAQAKKRGGKRGIRMTEEEMNEWVQGGRRVEVMRKALRLKFQDPELRRALLATGDNILVESLPRFPDNFWGTKKDGSGTNMLGRLLMEERDRIRRHASTGEDEDDDSHARSSRSRSRSRSPVPTA